jgi:hypothetical protein
MLAHFQRLYWLNSPQIHPDREGASTGAAPSCYPDYWDSGALAAVVSRECEHLVIYSTRETVQ